MLAPMAGVVTQPRQGIHAKEQDQNTRATAHPDMRHDSAEQARRGADGQQHGQRPKSEEKHQQRALGGAARRHRPGQRRVNQPAREPAPDEPGGQRFQRMIHRQEAPPERFDAYPEFSAEALERCQTRPPAGEIQPERDHESASDDFRGEARLLGRQHAHDLRAGQAQHGAGHGIAGDATDIVRGEVGKQPRGRGTDVLAHAERERADDAAAHAEAMGRAQQAHEEGREEGDFRGHEEN